MRSRGGLLESAAFVTIVLAGTAAAQVIHVHPTPPTDVRINVSVLSSSSPWAGQVVVPQARTFRMAAADAVEVTCVEAGAVILEQVATTTLDISLRNPGARVAEAELLIPVPAD